MASSSGQRRRIGRDKKKGPEGPHRNSYQVCNQPRSVIVEELTVTKVMLLKPVPSPPEVTDAPEMKMDPAPEVSKVIVEVVALSSTREVEGAGGTQSRVNCNGQTICASGSEASCEVDGVISIRITEVEG